MSQHRSRALLDVQIACDSDIDRARAAMKRVADEVWHADPAIIEEPEVWGVQTLGPGGITISAGRQEQTARAVADQPPAALADQIRSAHPAHTHMRPCGVHR
jgi:hypothetical protein